MEFKTRKWKKKLLGTTGGPAKRGNENSFSKQRSSATDLGDFEREMFKQSSFQCYT